MPFPVPAAEAARIASVRELAILDTADVGQGARRPRQLRGPAEASFCARTIMLDDVLVVPDTLADPVWATNPQVTGDPELRFYAGAPIRDEHGHALGSVCVADRTPRELDAGQLDALLRRADEAMYVAKRASPPPA